MTNDTPRKPPENKPPENMPPDGPPRPGRKTGDERADRNTVDPGSDPDIAGDAGGTGYANTDEARPDEGGDVRDTKGQPHPLI